MKDLERVSKFIFQLFLITKNSIELIFNMNFFSFLARLSDMRAKASLCGF